MPSRPGTVALATLLALGAVPQIASAEDAAVLCNGLEATIVGTEARDELSGTNGRDVIAGLGGDDSLKGFGGDDVICGGPGDDWMYGGVGNDRLISDTGFVDTFWGDAGDDVFDASLAVQAEVRYDDSPAGVVVDMAAGYAEGDGSDVLIELQAVTGSEHDDRIFGDRFQNFLRGAGGDDLVVGRGGTDSITPGDGSDVVRGGTDDDYIDLDEFGDSRFDRVSGNAGDDVVYFVASAARFNGGDGLDTADFSRESYDGGIVIDLAAGTGQAGKRKRLLGIERVRGSDEHDRLFGSSGPDMLLGEKGDDVIRGRKGRDDLGGDEGNDLLFGAAHNDRLVGGPGDDVLDGGGGTDQCDGESTTECESSP